LIGTKKNVRLIPPVGSDDIIPYISQYDIGIYLLEPNNFNNKHALPNKFFEFIQGRLAIAIGPSPEMAKIVTDYDLGLISKDFDAKNLAETVNSFTTDKIIYYKEKSNLASKEFNSFENYLKLHEKIKSWIE
jgi:hypothetical protein